MVVMMMMVLRLAIVPIVVRNIPRSLRNHPAGEIKIPTILTITMMMRMSLRVVATAELKAGVAEVVVVVIGRKKEVK